MGAFFLHPPKKNFLSPLQFGQEANITGNSIERRGYWFVLKIARVPPILTEKVEIGWWTLLQ